MHRRRASQANGRDRSAPGSGTKHLLVHLVVRLVVAGTLAGALGGAPSKADAESSLADDRAAPSTLSAPDDRWRARGMAFVDLPLGIRARVEGRALHRLGTSYELTASLAEHADGASRRSARLLESRFALSRAVASHVEIELAWSALSPLSTVDLLRIEDQRIATMIRFVP